MSQITALEQVFESKLTWPEHKPRAAHRIGSVFRTEAAKAQREVEEEMARWGIKRFLTSRNNQRIFAGDPGAAVWWEQPGKKPGEPPALKVIACDRYNTLAANLHAIALTLDALRAIERWGAYTTAEATEGAKVLALPAPEAWHWRAVFDMASAAHRAMPAADQLALVNVKYRKMASNAAGDPDAEKKLQMLNLGIEDARKELGA